MCESSLCLLNERVKTTEDAPETWAGTISCYEALMATAHLWHHHACSSADKLNANNNLPARLCGQQRSRAPKPDHAGVETAARASRKLSRQEIYGDGKLLHLPDKQSTKSLRRFAACGWLTRIVLRDQLISRERAEREKTDRCASMTMSKHLERVRARERKAKDFQ